ncbi:MAG: hypothetical protein J5586_08915 [Clostridia bacterium]|nr:hypothetical protein [Clostridia bacterium]
MKEKNHAVWAYIFTLLPLAYALALPVTMGIMAFATEATGQRTSSDAFMYLLLSAGVAAPLMIMLAVFGIDHAKKARAEGRKTGWLTAAAVFSIVICAALFVFHIIMFRLAC